MRAFAEQGPPVPFEIRVHTQDRILEVVYPQTVTAFDLSDYATRVRAAIDTFDGPWSDLVDQRQMPILNQDVLQMVKAMNGYAATKRMRKSARIVSDAVSGLQVWRMAKDAGVSVPVRAFQSRDEALAWLRSDSE